jgi:uncharacterized protein
MANVIVDVFKTSISRFIEGGQEVFQDFRTGPWQTIKNFDINNIDWNNINWGFVLFGTVILGFVLVAIIANLTPEYKAPGASPINAALGSGSQAKHNKDTPPIPPPTEVISLRIYPIKSCRGIEIDATRLRKTGLTLDRNWMFIGKSDRKFLTIRSDPSMTLIDTAVVDNGEKGGEQMLEVSIHGTDARITIPAFPTKQWLESNTTLSKVEIWEQETDAWEYPDNINKIFSQYFRKDVALVYKGPTKRMNAVNGRKELYGTEVPHHFADVVSLQVASEASIKDLNRHLKEKGASNYPLTIERFRPNIIVRGRDDQPWEEDTWKRIRFTTSIPEEEALYKIDLDVVARCARCQVPNVNPDTAEKHPKEPWDELMKFRRVDTGSVAKYKPCFGMLCIPKNEGKIRVGAKLEVLETTGRHLYNTAKFEEL